MKRIKRDLTNKDQLMRSLEKLQLQQVRASVAKETRSHQVSASDSSSAVQTIVSINKHPAYFGSGTADTFSDGGGAGADSENLAQNHLHKDLLVHSPNDTNTHAVASDQQQQQQAQSKKHRRPKHPQSHSGQPQQDDSAQAHGQPDSRPKEKSTQILSPSERERDATDRATHSQFEPGYGKLPFSPCN